ncbi:MAG: glycosyltransferase family 1 protein [Desulfovibrionales bacterium]
MHILMMAINDPAGTAIAFSRAINKYTDHSCRLITKEIRYNFMFEKDLHLPWLGPDGLEELSELFKTSDIFHFHMTADEHTPFGPFLPTEHMRGKAIVHHHHGHPDFRSAPQKFREKYAERNRKNLLVSTPDLLKLLPEADWQPNLVPENDPLYSPADKKPDSPVRLVHSPTRTELKDTDMYKEYVNELIREIPGKIESDTIRNTPHVKCLQRKQRAHILFDHLQGYFGVSSLEGLAQGVCTIAGLDEWNREHIRKFAGVNKLPWFISSPMSLKNDLTTLIRDKELRAELGQDSRTFMEKYWPEEKVVQKLSKFYQNILK